MLRTLSAMLQRPTIPLAVTRVGLMELLEAYYVAMRLVDAPTRPTKGE